MQFSGGSSKGLFLTLPICRQMKQEEIKWYWWQWKVPGMVIQGKLMVWVAVPH